jgi:hypothetical protein
VGDCRVWRHSKSKRGETRGFKKRLHIASLLSGGDPALNNLPKTV